MNGLYRISPAAQADLDDIWDYLAERNPAAASKLLQGFEKAFFLLADNPMIGRSREELLPNLRSFPVAKYLIFYSPLEGNDLSVEIIRVLHGARDLPSIFG